MTANNIKNLRTQKHVSQEQLAEKARVSVRTIQRLEAGEDASIESLNLIAGALNVEVGDLFAQENKKDDRVQETNDQLQYQLQRRREEYRLFKRAYDMIFIVVMMVLAAYLGFDNGWSQLASILWACGWMLFGISRRLVQLNIYDPHLDKKYPLTASRPDKDRKGK